MSQQGMTQPSSLHASRCLGLTALVIACALGAGGCHLAENIDLAVTSEPPHHPHDFQAPVSYGYFPTMWRPWPGAEAVPGQTMSRAKPERETESESTADTLPEPSDETAPSGTTEPGMENVFDLPATPEERAPREPREPRGGEEPPAALPETPDALPDELIPPEGDAPAKAEAPEKPLPPPAEEEMIPDELIPDENPAAPKTSSTNGPWDLESLPTDAPEGSLIPDAPESIVAKPSRPGLLTPESKPRRPASQSPRIENASRPSTKHGAKATLIEPENAIRELSGHKTLPVTSESGLALDGPQLIGTTAPTEEATPTLATDTDSAAAANRADSSASNKRNDAQRWSAARTGGTRKPTAIASDTGQAPATWRPSASRDRFAAPAVPRSHAAQVSRPNYPAVQTAHTDAEPASEPAVERDRNFAPTTGRGANPLR